MFCKSLSGLGEQSPNEFIFGYSWNSTSLKTTYVLKEFNINIVPPKFHVVLAVFATLYFSLSHRESASYKVGQQRIPN